MCRNLIGALTSPSAKSRKKLKVKCICRTVSHPNGTQEVVRCNLHNYLKERYK